jgi:hypothetical protein
MLGRPVRRWGPFASAVAILLVSTHGFAAASSDTRRSVQSVQAGGKPLVTGVVALPPSDPSETSAFVRNLRQTGGRVLRIFVYWDRIAPLGKVRPAGFDALDPGDPAYQWAELDRSVRAAIAGGASPFLSVFWAPYWALEGGQQSGRGTNRPSPAALAQFMFALTTRYSGRFEGLPRVRYFGVWNEPNLNEYLSPQWDARRVPVTPDWYRDMVNASADVIHGVHRDNFVIAGELAPFGGPFGPHVRMHPLEFMRRMLCVSAGATPKPTCNREVRFDAWAHHPYTFGGPTRQASHRDDVSIGDLGEMRRLLDAASAAGHIVSRRRPAFWVTEFSYDSKPADPKGLGPALHARWTSEALFRMWQSNVRLVAWFQLRDGRFPQDVLQSGLYMRGKRGISSDKPKPALRAFRLPFVAFREKDRSISYWGRTPTSTKQAILVEQKRGVHWARVATPTVDRYGIFLGRVANAQGNGALRARLADGSDVSLPFSLEVPKDFAFCPWGSGC